MLSRTATPATAGVRLSRAVSCGSCAVSAARNAPETVGPSPSRRLSARMSMVAVSPKRSSTVAASARLAHDPPPFEHLHRQRVAGDDAEQPRQRVGEHQPLGRDLDAPEVARDDPAQLARRARRP